MGQFKRTERTVVGLMSLRFWFKSSKRGIKVSISLLLTVWVHLGTVCERGWDFCIQPRTKKLYLPESFWKRFCPRYCHCEWLHSWLQHPFSWRRSWATNASVGCLPGWKSTQEEKPIYTLFKCFFFKDKPFLFCLSCWKCVTSFLFFF